MGGFCALCETEEEELRRKTGLKRSGDNVTLLLTVFVGTVSAGNQGP